MQQCAMNVASTPIEPVQPLAQPLVQQNSPASSSQTLSLSQKIRIISTSQSSSSYPKNKYEVYEAFPLTRELLQTRKHSLSLELFHRQYSNNISAHNNIQTEKQEESIQTECSFFDRCDEATQTESSDVERCCCIIS
jgi:hypothetical protein